MRGLILCLLLLVVVILIRRIEGIVSYVPPQYKREYFVIMLQVSILNLL